MNFIVKLGDGSEHSIEIDSVRLRDGDTIAFRLAVEHQARGRFRPAISSRAKSAARGVIGLMGQDLSGLQSRQQGFLARS